jgi:hypothetical protein
MPKLLPRLLDRCSENLAAMPKTERGVFCSKCRIDVVDLRTTPKKKALAVLAELRQTSKDGRVCAWLPVDRQGVPVFRPDPPPVLQRIAVPALLAGSLAACAPGVDEVRATPIVHVEPTSGGNDNAVQVRPAPAHAVVTTTTQGNPPTGVVAFPDVEIAAGGMAYYPGP